MNIYNQNLDYLCQRQGFSVTEFENIIYIPKVKIMEPTPNELIRISDYFNIPADTLLRKDLKLYDRMAEKNIKLVLLDVDGTMTDGGMYFTENGDQMKRYNTKDGMAIKRCAKLGIQFGIISHGHKLNVVKTRADLLGIQRLYVGQQPKIEIMAEWCADLGIDATQVAFVGDDINDLEIMKTVGLSACPSDAVSSIKTIADVILTRKGGDACVREFLDEWI